MHRGYTYRTCNGNQSKGEIEMKWKHTKKGGYLAA